MDHLNEAKHWANTMESAWSDDREAWAIANSRFAIAHALIALVERLDKVIATDCEGKTGSISVDTGL